MINDNEYKERLKELCNKDDISNVDFLLERKFIKDSEEETEVDESSSVFKDMNIKKPVSKALPKITPSTSHLYDRRRDQVQKVSSQISREKLSQSNQQRYLDAMNKNK
jgi:hypothetical protein